MPARRPLLIASLVLLGLATCASAVLLGVAGPHDPLPGIALGSELILAVERTLVLFAAWMLVLVVVMRALDGELPTELSSRGVRYADAAAAEQAAGRTSRAVAAIEVRLDRLSEDVWALQRSTVTTGDRADTL